MKNPFENFDKVLEIAHGREVSFLGVTFAEVFQEFGKGFFAGAEEDGVCMLSRFFGQ